MVLLKRRLLKRINQKRAAVKFSPIALEDNRTYRSHAVRTISIKGETGDFVGAVIVARTRDSKFTRSCYLIKWLRWAGGLMKGAT
jgi:hypothetical protein